MSCDNSVICQVVKMKQAVVMRSAVQLKKRPSDEKLNEMP